MMEAASASETRLHGATTQRTASWPNSCYVIYSCTAFTLTQATHRNLQQATWPLTNWLEGHWPIMITSRNYGELNNFAWKPELPGQRHLYERNLYIISVISTLNATLLTPFIIITGIREGHKDSIYHCPVLVAILVHAPSRTVLCSVI
jgi:hypothetical protein